MKRHGSRWNGELNLSWIGIGSDERKQLGALVGESGTISFRQRFKWFDEQGSPIVVPLNVPESGDEAVD
ncbi:hypothetical protein [Halocatena marina]|uniref:Uncharacterized protein n=1 Tax=Halocatena marina TaxID=2934937 RepID=A0ABD5YVW9_9EURY|nr:hypothetical protein [Halocatena marina]